MNRSREKFFSRANLHTAIWSVGLGVGAFYCLKLYNSVFGEDPQRVVVENFPQPTVVTQASQRPPQFDDSTKEELRKMRATTEAAIKELRGMKSSASASQKADAERRIAQLELQVQALEKAKGTATETPGLSAPNPPTSVSVDLIEKWPYKPYATVVYPTRPSPDFTAPGAYLLSDRPKLLSDYRCPETKVIQENSRIRIAFSIATAARLSQMSPLSLRVLRDVGPNKLEQYFEATLAAAVGPNVIELETNFNSGKHYLSLGYFLRDELSAKLPTLYAMTCELDVPGAAATPVGSVSVQ